MHKLATVAGLLFVFGCQSKPAEQPNFEGPYGEQQMVLVGVFFDFDEIMADIRRALAELERKGIRGEEGDSNLGMTAYYFPRKDAKQASEFLIERSRNAKPRWFQSLDEWCANHADYNTYRHAFSSAEDLLRRKLYAHAVAYFSAAIRVKPDSIEAYVGRARANDLREETEAAICDFEKAAALDPSGGEGYRREADRVRQSKR